tara:strand:+ start:122 stop:466 length:345 start_codon:yes stop_codon:yes gene_type:complete
MKKYVAVVTHDSGVITQYQDFDSKADADAHVEKYGGKVVQEIDNSFEYWDVSGDTPVKDTDQEKADATEAGILQKIYLLEAEITPRRMREAILGTDSDWLKNKEAEIAEERAKL